jgi:hypothetical protein
MTVAIFRIGIETAGERRLRTSDDSVCTQQKVSRKRDNYSSVAHATVATLCEQDVSISVV